MKTEIAILKPLGPLHLQTGGMSHETVETFPRADTISAALTYLWFRQEGSVPGFPDDLPFRVSSCMPVIEDSKGERIILYPMPTGLKIDPVKTDHKMFKGIEWIDEMLFEKWRRAGDESIGLPEDVNDQRLVFGGKVLLNESRTFKAEKLYEQQSRTRVILDRSSNASTPFHFVSTCFGYKTYLSLHFQVEDTSRSTFLGLLRLLGDEGIGADRTIGMGMFSVEDEIKNMEFIEGASTTNWINLGLFNPGQHTHEIDWMNSRYALSTRKGWVTGKSVRRAPVPVVSERAVLKTVNSKKPEGCVPLVLDNDSTVLPDEAKPGYSIYRDCRGFFIPCHF